MNISLRNETPASPMFSSSSVCIDNNWSYCVLFYHCQRCSSQEAPNPDQQLLKKDNQRCLGPRWYFKLGISRRSFRAGQRSSRLSGSDRKKGNGPFVYSKRSNIRCAGRPFLFFENPRKEHLCGSHSCHNLYSFGRAPVCALFSKELYYYRRQSDHQCSIERYFASDMIPTVALEGSDSCSF